MNSLWTVGVLMIFIPGMVAAQTVSPTTVSDSNQNITVTASGHGWSIFNPAGDYCYFNNVNQTLALKALCSATNGNWHLVGNEECGSNAFTYASCKAAGSYNGTDITICAGGSCGSGGTTTATTTHNGFSTSTPLIVQDDGDVQYLLAWIIFLLAGIFIGQLWNATIGNFSYGN